MSRKPHLVEAVRDTGRLAAAFMQTGQHLLDRVTGRTQKHKDAEYHMQRDVLEFSLEQTVFGSKTPEAAQKNLEELCAQCFAVRSADWNARHDNNHELKDEETRLQLAFVAEKALEQVTNGSLSLSAFSNVVALAPEETGHLWRYFPEAFDLSSESDVKAIDNVTPKHMAKEKVVSVSKDYIIAGNIGKNRLHPYTSMYTGEEKTDEHDNVVLRPGDSVFTIEELTDVPYQAAMAFLSDPENGLATETALGICRFVNLSRAMMCMAAKGQPSGPVKESPTPSP